MKNFYKGINKVEPSLIRVNADEATYNLHIMLRLELEIAMVEGKIAIKDLPEIWNSKMKEYLGITPPNDALGVLQDIHWSYGSIGYFSTYALGNLVSAQLWETDQQGHQRPRCPDPQGEVRWRCLAGCEPTSTNMVANMIRRHLSKRLPVRRSPLNLMSVI